MVRLMQRQTYVWGVDYRFRRAWWKKHAYGKWNPEWAGPIGVNIRESVNLRDHWHKEVAGRPYFFRTRALARNWVRKRYPKGSACQGRVRKFALTWEPVEKAAKNG